MIAKAIVAVSHTRYFRFSPKIPLPTRHAHSPFATAQGAAVKERGHLTAALSSRAGSAVPRDAKRNPVNKLFLYVLAFNMQITHRCPTMLPPRGHQSAYRLNQRRTERRAFFIQAALGFPGVLPLRGTSAHSPFAVLFCSAPPLGRGSGHALSKSFAFFCASRNARVPLRYASQPFRRKIYTKSFAQCFVITFI